MDEGFYTGLVLIDLQKAFDTVDHVILLDKLTAIGADEDAVGWFRSYLSQRRQFVEVNGTKSSFENVNCGVPQGSILGPLLFIIYVNDMVDVVHCDLFLYADDSALVVRGRNINEIESKLENEINAVSKWLVTNKLSLHLGKTESIVFASKKKLKKCSKMKIVCNGISIDPKDSVKYLGATLEPDLSGKLMGHSVIKKVNSGLKFLYRKAAFFSIKEKKLLRHLCFNQGLTMRVMFGIVGWKNV
jgi:hypothetical protein